MEKLRNQYSIVVNSCDSFEDCWHPFFTLLFKYWPDLNVPIYLNTELKDWHKCRQVIKCTQVQLNEARKLTWSECLLKALDQVETPLVLYFQEDYFIHQPVDSNAVQTAAEYLIDNPEAKRIALTRYSGPGPFIEYKEPWLKLIDQKAPYRISTQAGLWRVDALRSYLDKLENGWMFEIFGTWRSQSKSEVFLTMPSNMEGNGLVIDYLPTGIIKGQWLPEIKDVFESNGIHVDYMKRGFHIPKKGLTKKFAVAKKLLEDPRHFANQFYSRFGL